MQLFLIGLNHRTAGLALRERVAIPPREVPATLTTLRATFPSTEFTLLSTCNRVEIYLSSAQGLPSSNDLLQWLARRSDLAPEALRPHVYCYTGHEVAAHLFQVTAGLDSMILGESEVTAQVKQAYLAAHAQGATGPVLNRLFQKALHCAKVARATTRIGFGSASIGSVVVTLARQVVGDDLAGRQALLWGAGKAAETTARHLITHGIGQLWVVNRTASKAQELASLCQGGWLSWEQARRHLAHVDIAVVCTQAPHYVIDRHDLDAVLPQRAGRPLCVVDLAVPRNVDPSLAEHPSVRLFNIDDLQGLAGAGLQQRRQELGRCAELIDQRVAQVMQWCDNRTNREVVSCQFIEAFSSG